MTTKWKLHIPTRIHKNTMPLLHKYYDYDGKEVHQDIVDNIIEDGFGGYLEEIEEPETFEDWMEKEHGIDWEKDIYDWMFVEKCHNWSVDNERKKHEPKKTPEDLWRSIEPDKFFSGAQTCLDFENILKLADKNRGYDD